MVTANNCLKKFGDPEKELWMTLWVIPREITQIIPELPSRIYCNKLMPDSLRKAFNNLINRGFEDEFKTWDGCFNIRKKIATKSMSLHSWGIAIDLNAGWNAYKAKPTLSPGFVKCFKDAGFDWGGDWQVPDGMHFQAQKI